LAGYRSLPDNGCSLLDTGLQPTGAYRAMDPYNRFAAYRPTFYRLLFFDAFFLDIAIKTVGLFQNIYFSRYFTNLPILKM